MGFELNAKTKPQVSLETLILAQAPDVLLKLYEVLQKSGCETRNLKQVLKRS
ncbi:hypothetical protein SK128_017200, partial [Halocaridina rubra]